MCIALVKALREDYLRLSSIQTHSTAIQYTSANASWQQLLDGLLMLPNRAQALTFLKQVVQPAIEKVGIRIRKELEVQIIMDEDKVRLLIPKSDDIDFVYSVHIRAFSLPSYAEDDGGNEKNIDEQDKHYYRAEVFLEHGGQQYDIMGYTEEQVIADILTQYEKHLYYIHVSNAGKALV